MWLWLVLVLVWLLYKWSINTFDFFTKLGVPFDKPLPFFGNGWNLMMQKESMIELLQRSYDKYKGDK